MKYTVHLAVVNGEDMIGECLRLNSLFGPDKRDEADCSDGKHF
jgi:hypothetical protein